MENYLTFSSPEAFTLATANAAKNWDGVLEYSTDTITWNEWDGTTTLSADIGKLYLRGIGNTVIAGESAKKWVLSGSNIACEGNIENLLDYATVSNGEHPTMGDYCFQEMFYGCTSLIKAPALPATTLESYCYASMFSGCTSLVNAPALPATTLASACYEDMFAGCTSLVSAPALPAATTAVTMCYRRMFKGCTSLVSLPALPATALKPVCYTGMFSGCTKIKLSTTQTEEYATPYRIPTDGTGRTTGTAAQTVSSMFADTGGTFTGTPEINTTYYTSNKVIYADEATPTIITYNGEEIASFEAGQTATIKTANTEIEHDIVITPTFPINIAYGDIIATADEGQTATIKTANTEADFDIVVSAKA